MSSIADIQKQIFVYLKEKLPPSLSFVHEISEILGISYDSAYRRIRGEKDITLEELYKLTSHYNFSIDKFFHIESNQVLFGCHPIDHENYRIKPWLQNVLDEVLKVKAAREKECIYAFNDMPVFHYWHLPEIGAFKVFFWQKSVYQFPDFADKKLRLDDFDPEIWAIGQKIVEASSRVPSIEIWNDDTFNISLRQIEYYITAGYFEKKDDIFNLYDKLEKWVRHLHKQAEHGFKFPYGTREEGQENSFVVYENELVLNDSTIFVKADNQRTVFLTYNVLNILTTQDEKLCRDVEKNLKALLKKSTVISLTNDKERNRFFNNVYSRIEQSRNTFAEGSVPANFH